VMVDASQSVSHLPIDVRKLDCDFLAFSSHKIFGPSGVGVLYVRKDRFEKLQLWNVGGGMVNYHGEDRFEVREAPFRYEAGTPNIEGAIGLGAALEYVRAQKLDEIAKHSRALGAPARRLARHPRLGRLPLRAHPASPRAARRHAARLCAPVQRRGGRRAAARGAARPAVKPALTLLAGRFAVARLPPAAPLPEWATGAFTSITRTPRELSIVCAEEAVPEDAKAERGFAALTVDGVLDFWFVGILAGLLRILADAGVSVLALSTFDTDWLLLRAHDVERAVAALRAHGHPVTT
jgi:hypothetical protein